jgi:hypothetical protein
MEFLQSIPRSTCVRLTCVRLICVARRVRHVVLNIVLNSVPTSPTSTVETGICTRMWQMTTLLPSYCMIKNTCYHKYHPLERHTCSHKKFKNPLQLWSNLPHRFVANPSAYPLIPPPVDFPVVTGSSSGSFNKLLSDGILSPREPVPFGFV